MRTKRILVVMMLLLSVLLAACGSKETATTEATGKETTAAAETTAAEETSSEVTPTADADARTPITADREGNPITLPETISTVISIGPSNTEILASLGAADKLIAVDKYSVGIAGIAEDLPTTDIMESDPEQIIALEPDVIFVTGMAKADGDDPYKPLSDAGICLVYMPTSTSIEGIKADIRFLADVMSVPEQGEVIVGEMEEEIAAIRLISDTITDKKSVYFEIGAPPFMMTLGGDTFISEMIEIIGAVNAFEGESGYVSVADEAVLAADPDIIFTNVNYVENPLEELKGRAGWDVLTAVSNDDVYLIDTNSSSRPSHNIITALKEMAKAAYPEEFKDLP